MLGTAGAVLIPAAASADGDETPMRGMLGVDAAGLAMYGEANWLAAGTLNIFPSAENALVSDGTGGMVIKLEANSEVWVDERAAASVVHDHVGRLGTVRVDELLHLPRRGATALARGAVLVEV